MIRLYGISAGHGSYGRVTRGVQGALQRLGLLDGLFPVDAFDEWGEYAGGDSPFALTVAPQIDRIARLPATVGDHVERAMLLPLNSSFCPRAMLDFASVSPHQPTPLVTQWLTPSEWSAKQLRKLTSAPVTVWRHGIEQDFEPNAQLADLRSTSFADGPKVLHMTSTPRERKGTEKLITAWIRLWRARKLPSTAKLALIVAEDPDGILAPALASIPSDVQASIDIQHARNLPPAAMARFLGAHHLVAQPSRGEGFGMVPLESLACGVPIVATTCSGHSEYLNAQTPGLSVVRHGEDAPIDDGPNALAPSVEVEDIADALERALETWPSLHKSALENSLFLRRRWSWDAVMYDWIAREGWSGP